MLNHHLFLRQHALVVALLLTGATSVVTHAAPQGQGPAPVTDIGVIANDLIAIHPEQDCEALLQTYLGQAGVLAELHFTLTSTDAFGRVVYATGKVNEYLGSATGFGTAVYSDRNLHTSGVAHAFDPAQSDELTVELSAQEITVITELDRGSAQQSFFPTCREGVFYGFARIDPLWNPIINMPLLTISFELIDLGPPRP